MSLPDAQSVEAWYRASNAHATFAFVIRDGKVIACAPYGRRWLLGKTRKEAVREAQRRGFQVQPL